jgi:hypothetical protein
MNQHASETINGFRPVGIVSAGERVIVPGWVREGTILKVILGVYSNSANLEREIDLGKGVPRAVDQEGSHIAVGAIEYLDNGDPKAVVLMSSDNGEKWRKTEIAGLDLIGVRLGMDGEGFAWSASRLAITEHQRWVERGRIDAEYRLTGFALRCSERGVVLIAGSRQNAYEHWVVALEGDRFAKLTLIPGKVSSVVSVGNGTMILAIERRAQSGFELIAWSPRSPNETIEIGRFAIGHVETMKIHEGNILLAGNEGGASNPWTSILWRGQFVADQLERVELKATRLNVKQSTAIGFADDMALWCFGSDERILRISSLQD